jgi:hypothetical protein
VTALRHYSRNVARTMSASKGDVNGDHPGKNSGHDKSRCPIDTSYQDSSITTPTTDGSRVAEAARNAEAVFTMLSALALLQRPAQL